MAVCALWEDCMSNTVLCQMLEVYYLPFSLYLCCLELCCAEIGILAFIRFPVAFKALPWLEWV